MVARLAGARLAGVAHWLVLKPRGGALVVSSAESPLLDIAEYSEYLASALSYQIIHFS